MQKMNYLKEAKENYFMHEYWKTIIEASNYEISNLGNVRNRTTTKILKGRLSKSGYLQVSIKLDETQKFTNKYIHRLVATYWIENVENKREVNHIDGNKENNCVDNLEWVTPSENQKHRHLLGNNKTSHRRVGKFNKEGVMIAEYESIVAAAAAEGSPRVSIDNVLQGKRYTLKGFVWKYLD